MDYIFDTHAHYDDEKFDPDRAEVLASLQENGIRKAVDVGAGIPSSKRAQSLAAAYDFLYCALGVHPTEVGDLNDETRAWLRTQAASDPKCVAIGEIGLDYYWEDTPHEDQKREFLWQMDLARELGKPIIIHSREAARDTYDLMKEARAGEIGGVLHCYSYTREMAREFLEMDFYFGVGGVITFKNSVKLKEAAQYIPLDRIVLETDCPYLAPVPFRGKRNSSLYLPYVVEALAQVRGISEEEVLRATWENAHRLYRLPDPLCNEDGFMLK